MRVYLLVLCVLVPTLGFAQHPCDLPPVAGDTHPEGLITFSWCHEAASMVSWKLYVNDAPLTLTNVSTTGVRSNSGTLLYTATVRFARGNYDLAMTAVSTAGESGKSNVFRLRCQRVPRE